MGDLSNDYILKKKIETWFSYLVKSGKKFLSVIALFFCGHDQFQISQEKTIEIFLTLKKV